jgi:hypothetical protein
VFARSLLSTLTVLPSAKRGPLPRVGKRTPHTVSVRHSNPVSHTPCSSSMLSCAPSCGSFESLGPVSGGMRPVWFSPHSPYICLSACLCLTALAAL